MTDQVRAQLAAAAADEADRAWQLSRAWTEDARLGGPLERAVYGALWWHSKLVELPLDSPHPGRSVRMVQVPKARLVAFTRVSDRQLTRVLKTLESVPLVVRLTTAAGDRTGQRYALTWPDDEVLLPAPEPLKVGEKRRRRGVALVWSVDRYTDLTTRERAVLGVMLSIASPKDGCFYARNATLQARTGIDSKSTLGDQLASLAAKGYLELKVYAPGERHPGGWVCETRERTYTVRKSVQVDTDDPTPPAEPPPATGGREGRHGRAGPTPPADRATPPTAAPAPRAAEPTPPASPVLRDLSDGSSRASGSDLSTNHKNYSNHTRVARGGHGGTEGEREAVGEREAIRRAVLRGELVAETGADGRMRALPPPLPGETLEARIERAKVIVAASLAKLAKVDSRSKG